MLCVETKKVSGVCMTTDLDEIVISFTKNTTGLVWRSLILIIFISDSITGQPFLERKSIEIFRSVMHIPD